MGDDLFAIEQKILNEAIKYSKELKEGTLPEISKYEELTSNYAKLLKQLRMLTKVSDRTTVSLNTSVTDLLDIVHVDVMTGVHNRKYLEDNMDRIVKTLIRSNKSLGLMMVDVDYFKKYNDTYGHTNGDNCLKAVAATIQQSLFRAEDFVVRFGGEEFMVVMPEADETAVRVVANRITSNIRTLEIPHEKSEIASHVTVSAGATSALVTPEKTFDAYVQLADEALYSSKNAGRDRYTYMQFSEEAG